MLIVNMLYFSASYGSLARFDDQERLVQVGKQTVVGISGDISDLQHVERLLEQLVYV
jgi:20S proteasome subunit beta 7